ncbi:MAG: SDR family oxidoreductase [Verrucomicrobia bacterium]|nr:SDR family oxidoreductase [Verrucomicrobiota bacterium]
MPSLFTLTIPDVVVVSGAASGLGLELCQLLAGSGVTTIGIDRDQGSPQLEGSKHYRHVQGDVSKQEVWLEAVKLVRSYKPVSIGLATCAAILEVGDVLDTTEEHWTKAFRINVFGTVLGIQSVLPAMLEIGCGSIVTVASVDATFAEQQLAAYCASKGAVRQLARTIALDHARHGIRVNVLSPGPMLAGLFKRHMDSAADRDRFIATRANRQPYGRILSVEEVATAAVFLLSSQSSAFNGAELIADGGLTTGFDFRTGEEGASIK